MDMNDESDFERDQEDGQDIGDIQRKRLVSQDAFDDSIQLNTE